MAVDEQRPGAARIVRNGEIVLNVSADGHPAAAIGNERITFQARFGGVARESVVPIENVSAVYARENGHGMAFEVPRAMSAPALPAVGAAAEAAPAVEPREPPRPTSERPKLTRIK